MNKTVMFVTFSCLAALAISGSVVLAIVKPEANGNYIGFAFQILGLVTVAAGTFYGLGKANEKLEVVRKQTNGTLTGLLRTISEKDAEIARLKEKSNGSE